MNAEYKPTPEEESAQRRADNDREGQAECFAARRRCHAEGKDFMKPTNENTTAQQAVATGDLFGWVSIADRLPDLGEIVWLWEQGRGPWIGSRDDPDNEGWLWGNAYGTMWHNGQKWDADVEQDDEYKPTHWQPLPLLPNTADDTRP